MNEFKEFQGKNLDEAIEAACRHYDLKRDKLEIEIIGGGSTGIFGLVGVKKAAVKARPRKAMSLQEMSAEQEPKAPRREEPKPAPKPAPAPEPAPAPVQEAAPQAAPAPEPAPAPAAEAAPAPAPEAPASEPQEAREPRPERERGRRDRRRGGGERQEQQRRQPRPERAEKPAPRPERSEDQDEAEEGLPRVDMTTLDPQILEQSVRQTITKLLAPMLPEPSLSVEITPDRVNVFIEDEENSGLIIGREGQTLSSLQYLLNRIVARRMGCSVRVQIDTGEYRERQDEKLRLMALHLADKANESGRTQSTKPLSSYHRRVVHVTLQDNDLVFTRSKGEGPMKRVLIVPKRKNGNR